MQRIHDGLSIPEIAVVIDWVIALVRHAPLLLMRASEFQVGDIVKIVNNSAWINPDYIEECKIGSARRVISVREGFVYTLPLVGSDQRRNTGYRFGPANLERGDIKKI